MLALGQNERCTPLEEDDPDLEEESGEERLDEVEADSGGKAVGRHVKEKRPRPATKPTPAGTCGELEHTTCTEQLWLLCKYSAVCPKD